MERTHKVNFIEGEIYRPYFEQVIELSELFYIDL